MEMEPLSPTLSILPGQCLFPPIYGLGLKGSGQPQFPGQDEPMFSGIHPSLPGILPVLPLKSHVLGTPRSQEGLSLYWESRMHVVPSHFQADCTRNCVDCAEQSITFLSIESISLDAPGDVLLLERMNTWSHPGKTTMGVAWGGPWGGPIVIRWLLC